MRRLTIIVIGLLAPVVTAQQPGVELIVPSTTLEQGESVDVELVCTNTGRPGLPKVVLPDGLDLRLVNPNPAQRSFISIVNTQRTQRVSYIYSLELIALKPGQYVLGPVTVEADGTTYQSRPVTITVSQADTSSTPRGDRLMFVEFNVQPRSLYVTQNVTADMVIGIRKVDINGRIYEMNLLKEVIDRHSQFSVFANSRAHSSTVMLPDSKGVRHAYQLYRVTKTIRADEIGELLIGPVFIKANYPTSLRRGFFGGYEVSRYQKETARADAITVEVFGPPEENRPDDFTGAIGQFTIHVDVKPDTVEQGQPVTLSIAIKGKPLEGVAGPNLAQHPELSSRFDFVKDELIGNTENEARVFRRAIFPRVVGGQTIPPISWSYFDPHAEEYVTLTSDPVSITVNPPSNGSTMISLGSEEGNRQNDTSLTVISGGISPNYVDPGVVLANHSFSIVGAWSIGSIVMPPLFYLLITITVKHRVRLKHDVGFARRRRALKQAQLHIDRALENSTALHQWNGLAEAITGYLTDRFNLPPGQLTPADARRLLSENHYDESLATQIAEFLETCDAVRYAPGAFDSLSLDQEAGKIRYWMAILEKQPP